MEFIGLSIFFAGFASGWAARTTVDSSRALVVKLLATAYGTVDRAGRAIGMEREHLEDLLAEARAKYEADRARETKDPGAEASPESGRVVPMRGRAA